MFRGFSMYFWCISILKLNLRLAFKHTWVYQGLPQYSAGERDNTLIIHTHNRQEKHIYYLINFNVQWVVSTAAKDTVWTYWRTSL